MASFLSHRLPLSIVLTLGELADQLLFAFLRGDLFVAREESGLKFFKLANGSLVLIFTFETGALKFGLHSFCRLSTAILSGEMALPFCEANPN